MRRPKKKDKKGKDKKGKDKKKDKKGKKGSKAQPMDGTQLLANK